MLVPTTYMSYANSIVCVGLNMCAVCCVLYDNIDRINEVEI